MCINFRQISNNLYNENINVIHHTPYCNRTIIEVNLSSAILKPISVLNNKVDEEEFKITEECIANNF